MDQYTKFNIISDTINFRDRRSIFIKNQYQSFRGTIRKNLFIFCVKIQLLVCPFTVRHNHFPYDLLLAKLDNAKQYAIFYANKPQVLELKSSELVITYGKKTTILLGIKDFVAWENDPLLKSIQSISHLQLIVERV